MSWSLRASQAAGKRWDFVPSEMGTVGGFAHGETMVLCRSHQDPLLRGEGTAGGWARAGGAVSPGSPRYPRGQLEKADSQPEGPGPGAEDALGPSEAASSCLAAFGLPWRGSAAR